MLADHQFALRQLGKPPGLTRTIRRSACMGIVLGAGSLALLGTAFAAVEPAGRPVPASDPACGLLTGWSLSPPYQPRAFAVDSYPTPQSWASRSWTAALCDPSGLVDIASQLATKSGKPPSIWARTVLHAAGKEIRPIEFGFRGAIAVYLNGRIVYRGKSVRPAPADAPPAAVGWDQTIFLPLEAGANELALSLAATAEGCAFMFRDLTVVGTAPGLKQLWELDDQLAAPESVACDRGRNVLYVSNFNGNSISKIGPDGTILALAWTEGLKHPTGLAVHDGQLYAVERTGVAVIDPDTGKITDRLPLAGAVFPNDLTFDDRGALYVTDSGADRIYRILDGKTEAWMQDAAINKPNGIHADRGRLLVGVTSDGTIKAVDLATRAVATLVPPDREVYPDGLTGDGRGGFVFSDYYGRIIRVSADGVRTLLLDRRGPRHFCADFAYVAETGLLLVPSLYDNRLTAYRYAPETP